MAGGSNWGSYLVQLNTGLAIPKGSFGAGTKILWGDKVESLGANGINGVTPSDLIRALPASGIGSIADKQTLWYVARGAPAGMSIADMRQYLCANSLMP